VAEQNRWRFSKGTGFKWLDREKRYAVQTSEWIFGYVLLNRSLVGPNAVRAPHPNAATVFLNWFLTRPGQEAFHRPHLYPSLRTDVPREYVPEYILPKPQLEYVAGYG